MSKVTLQEYAEGTRGMILHLSPPPDYDAEQDALGTVQFTVVGLRDQVARLQAALVVAGVLLCFAAVEIARLRGWLEWLT